MNGVKKVNNGNLWQPLRAIRPLITNGKKPGNSLLSSSRNLTKKFVCVRA